LRQVLNNLLSNAMKFTAQGAITLSVRAWPCGDDACALTLSVVDTGEGMDPDQIARLFQPFEQADDAVVRHHGGTGLGLSISRQLARAMGGELIAHSVRGAGSTFTLALTLPLAEPGVAELDPADSLSALAEALNADRPEPVAPVLADLAPEPEPEIGLLSTHAEDDPQDRPLRVLVADDHEINRRAVELVLAPTGALITMVMNGRLALEAAMLQPFDLIVMDVRMPEMNGREATRQLRSRAGPNRHTPVIAVTADTDIHDMEACRAAGMDWFVGKPIDPAKLIDTAVRALEQAEQARAEAETRRQVA
jgi:CheY-like chemotaxis protein